MAGRRDVAIVRIIALTPVSRPRWHQLTGTEPGGSVQAVRLAGLNRQGHEVIPASGAAARNHLGRGDCRRLCPCDAGPPGQVVLRQDHDQQLLTVAPDYPDAVDNR